METDGSPPPAAAPKAPSQQFTSLSILFIIVGLLLYYAIVYVSYNGLLINAISRQHAAADIYGVILYYRKWLFVAIFCSLLFSNMAVYHLVLDGTQYAMAAGIITLCLLGVIGTTFLLINNITIINIFENTIGYFLVTAAGNTDTLFHQIVTHPVSNNESFAFLLTAFGVNSLKITNITGGDPFNFSRIQSQTNTLVSSDGNLSGELLKQVVSKNTIGHLCWAWFASISSSLICLKYLSKNI